MSADPLGAVFAAATYPTAAQRHGASGSSSFRWWGQHSAARSAPQEAPGALPTCCQPSEYTVFVKLEDLYFRMCAIGLLSYECKL